MTVLYINRNDSRCGACNRGALMSEKAHDTICEYGPETGSPGCGAVFTQLDSEYSQMKDVVVPIRPDLEWIGGES